MTPVSLRLKNFLSYGEDAPELDFTKFHVACLSGRNGQGKSALLDAVTWAVWGTARNRSTVDELRRSGERFMEVVFEFDVEGDRYRVVRRAEKGRSQKLELHGKGPDDARFRPLTQPTKSNTERRIRAIVGLDYETFINSAFLLQGRSDEFARKRPAERKEILASILDLGRYESLRALARRYRERAGSEITRLEADQSRLSASAEKATALQAERDQLLQTAIGIERQRDQERTLVRQTQAEIARIDTLEASAASKREHLEDLRRHLQQLNSDHTKLQDNIQSANKIIADSTQILADYHKHRQLEREWEILDRKEAEHTDLSRELDRQAQELAMEKQSMEFRIREATEQLRHEQGDLEAIGHQEEKLKGLNQQIQASRQAQQREPVLGQYKREADELDQRIRRTLDKIESTKRELRREITYQSEKLRSEREQAENATTLQVELDRVDARVGEIPRAQADLAEIQDRGLQIAQLSAELRERLKAKERLRDRNREAAERISADKTGVCPTCGSVLSSEHKAQVCRDLEASSIELEKQIGAITDEVQTCERRRTKLRTAYRKQNREFETLKALEARRPTLQERFRRAQESANRHQALEEDLARMHGIMTSGEYASNERRQLSHLKGRRDAIEYDPAEHERVLQLALALEHLEEQVRAVQAAIERRQDLERSIVAKARHLQRLKSQYETGAGLERFETSIQQLRQQQTRLGFDAARLRAVRDRRMELTYAPERKGKLDQATSSVKQLNYQLRALTQRISETETDIRAKQRAWEEARAALPERQPLQDRLTSAAAQIDRLEKRLATTQTKTGQVDARLAHAVDDASLLKDCRKELRSVRRRQHLYGVLVQAFGRRGIPSLIMEDTLPEIERAATELLGRLTDGRMDIRLESQRSLKSRDGTMETLEIRIRDERGIWRPYETFSGGEAFRVNFALRLALSQLLASRAGVRVRTLVIDEGFGTQDTEGIARLTEAIDAIKDEFDKILVITHMEEMKEAFPVRIEVEKISGTGSRFDVLGV